MASALEHTGPAEAHQLGFAAQTVNRYVGDLAQLSEDEARAVWRATQEGTFTTASRPRTNGNPRVTTRPAPDSRP